MPLILGCGEGEARKEVEEAWRMFGIRRKKREGFRVSWWEKDGEGEGEVEEEGGDGSGEDGEEETEKREGEGRGGDGVENGNSVQKLEDKTHEENGKHKEDVDMGGEGGEDRGNSEVVSHVNPGLWVLFQRLTRTALRVQPVQTGAILRWLAAMASKLGLGLLPYLPLVILPLFRISEGIAGQIISEDLKILAEEVMEHLRSAVGVREFVSAFNSVREKMKKRRESRKIAGKIAALVDPESTARRKLKLSAKRQAQKKRKIQEFKRQRGDIHSEARKKRSLG